MPIHYAAGILPVTWYRGKLLFLVGKDIRDGCWSDFGGKAERYDRQDTIATASREMYEETYGTVFGQRAIRSLCRPDSAVKLLSSTQNNHPYTMYVIQIPYISHLRNMFHKAVNFLKSRNVNRTYIEKTDIEWVTWNDLQTIQKRSVFANTIAKHAVFFDKLSKMPSSEWKNLCLSRHFD